MRTVKIELSPFGETKKEVWNRIKELSGMSAKVANSMINSLYFSDQYRHFILSDKNHSNKLNRRREIKKEQMSLESLLKKDKKAKEKAKKEGETFEGLTKEDIEKSQERIKELKQSFKEVDNALKDMQKQMSNQYVEDFGVGPQAIAEREVKSLFPSMPSCITNPMVNEINSLYSGERLEVLTGKRTIRNYRSDIPMPFQKTSVEFYEDDFEGNDKIVRRNHFVKLKLGRDEHLHLRIYYGRDKANNKHTIKKIIDGVLKYAVPRLQYCPRKGKITKIFLMIPVEDGEKVKTLDPNISVGVDLGINVPAVTALSDGKQRLFLGNRSDFLRIRTGLQSRKRRLQRSLTMIKGGKGRKKKLSALSRLENKEGNFVKQYNHRLSRKVIDFALTHNAGVIKMEFLKGYGGGAEEDGGKKFFLRNWSYYQVQEMIHYKAKEKGIEVVMIDPWMTSQKCSVCGKKGHREGVVFKCKNPECSDFDEKVHADYNGAKNVALCDKIVTKKEETMYYYVTHK